jgi:hypothetical protein
MPPIFRILPRLLLVYLKLLGFIASDGSPQEGRFMIDRWQRWQKSGEARYLLDPWLSV